VFSKKILSALVQKALFPLEEGGLEGGDPPKNGLNGQLSLLWSSTFNMLRRFFVIRKFIPQCLFDFIPAPEVRLKYTFYL
jgi:hypothetical protein